MKAIPTAEQREFATMLRALLSAQSPVSWQALADVGVFGLAIAEQYGGSGGTLDDLAVFYTEAGRALCPTTVHSTVQAGLAIDQLGPPDVKAVWLPPLASGSIRGTTALWGARDAAHVSGVLSADADPAARWRLNGIADYVA